MPCLVCCNTAYKVRSETHGGKKDAHVHAWPPVQLCSQRGKKNRNVKGREDGQSLSIASTSRSADVFDSAEITGVANCTGAMPRGPVSVGLRVSAGMRTYGAIPSRALRLEL